MANFGVEDGRIFAGQDGITNVTVTNGEFTDNVQVTVATFAPTPLSYIDLKQQANNVALQGDYAYVATDTGLVIVDTSDPSTPFIAGSAAIGKALDVKVDGVYVYLATATGLAVVSVNDVAEPEYLATYTDLGAINDIALENGRAYLATETNGFAVLNLQNPTAPALVGSVILGSVINAVAVEGELAVVVSGDVLIALGVTVPSSPVELGRANVPGAKQVAIKGKHAFVAAGSATYYPSVDFTDPINPVVNETPRDFLPNDVVVRGDHAFYAEIVFPSAIPIVNIKDPNNPLYQALIDMSDYGDYDCNGVDADLSYVVCSARNRLYIGQYRELQDVAGIAPEISWQTPALGQELYQNRPYRVSADVIDDVRVALVNFYANGVRVHTDVTPP